MIDRLGLARSALRKALSIRRRLGIDITASVCPEDVAGRLDLDVRYLDLPSLEGMFVREQALVLLPSNRPSGRRAFSAAHEIGHFAFGHGTRVDVSARNAALEASGPDEFLADAFAGFLLMPHTAVMSSLSRACFSCSSLDRRSAFKLASEFGVGYETLLNHFHYSLRILDDTQFKRLFGEKPTKIRKELCPDGLGPSLVYVTQNWRGRPIDAAAGDDLLLPPNTCVAGLTLENRGAAPDGSEHYVARHPGVGRVSCGSWSTFVRIQRANYAGRAVYRHLEEADD